MGRTVSIARAVDRWPWTWGRETATVGGRTRKQNIGNKWSKQKEACGQGKKNNRETRRMIIRTIDGKRKKWKKKRIEGN